MAILTFNSDSLRRGKVTEAEAKEALDDPMAIDLDLAESKQGNPTVIYVGKTQTERLLEIGVEYRENENHVYHARKANKNYQRLYEASHNKWE